jgi:tellurite methyltransferase
MTASGFVLEWLPRIRRAGSPRALDVAMGRGSHAIPIARAGFHTFGVDIRFDAVAEAMAVARGEHIALAAWCADLEAYPLPEARFDLIVVTRYLQRSLFPALCEALAPDGVILYETFTTAQRAHGVGPTSPDHLLEPGELRARLSSLDVLFYEDVDRGEAVARIAARRRRAANFSKYSSGNDTAPGSAGPCDGSP